ncbi:MAG TPA: TIGR02996 domain-containing protein [Gemmataceae bacterium]|jgi:uncharacterized protein (TIGR02996 family)
MAADADFLRLILADPDADGPRLVYADWLDDQGQPARAEFVRVQCALAALLPDDPRAAALHARADVLLEQHRVAWSGPLAGLATRWDFRRGFPEVVRMEARVFLARGEELFAAVPVRHVELLDAAAHLPRLGGCPLLERLAALTIAGCPAGDAVAKAVAKSSHVGRLTALYLPRNGLTDAAVRSLARAAALERLTTLDLTDNDIGPAGAHTLAAGAHLAGLTTLRLRANPLGPDGAAAVLTSTRLAQLTTLDLAQTRCTLAALEGLPETAAGRLAALSLAGNDLGDLGADLLARWPPLAGLRSLDLSRTGLGDAGAAALADSPHVAGLRRLALNGNRMTEAGKRRLLASPYLQRLTALELSDNWTAALAAFRR